MFPGFPHERMIILLRMARLDGKWQGNGDGNWFMSFQGAFGTGLLAGYNPLATSELTPRLVKLGHP